MEQQNNNRLTLGSLFDGSGGFPLGGVLAGILSEGLHLPNVQDCKVSRTGGAMSWRLKTLPKRMLQGGEISLKPMRRHSERRESLRRMSR